MERRVRETSIEAFKKITENGLLSKILTEVYCCIYEHGPLTIKETCMRMKHMPETSISPVFARLEDRGVIRAGDKRPCKITGNNAISWDVTANLPVVPEKRKSSREIIEEQAKKIRSLENEVAQLKAKYEPTPDQAIGQLNLFNQSVSKSFPGTPARP